MLAHGIAISIHGTYYINICILHEKIRKNIITYTVIWIRKLFSFSLKSLMLQYHFKAPFQATITQVKGFHCNI